MRHLVKQQKQADILRRGMTPPYDAAVCRLNKKTINKPESRLDDGF
jgi:hypothetical protein